MKYDETRRKSHISIRPSVQSSITFIKYLRVCHTNACIVGEHVPGAWVVVVRAVAGDHRHEHVDNVHERGGNALLGRVEEPACG
jgi:hypothetical protein